jgi:hypothetical protein
MGFILAGVPNVRRQAQGRFPAAPQNLLAVNVGELLAGFQTMKVLSGIGKYNERWSAFLIPGVP